MNVVLEAQNEVIYNTFSVTIDDRYIAHQANNLIVCDDETDDGFTPFYLNEQNDQISNGQTIIFSVQLLSFVCFFAFRLF